MPNISGPVALVGLHLLFALVALAGRTLIQIVRHRDWGFRLGHADRTAGAASAAMILGWLTTVASIPVHGHPQPGVAAVGVAAYMAGVGLTAWAQLVMGASWRIGVDPNERTDLVTSGPFGHIRNPIFTGMIAALAGITILTWSLLALAGLALVLAGVELQVRAVEEPYLRRAHDSYASYQARTGRFVPNLG